jgi:RNA polymerase sigma-70 factor (ECF subfamily)
MDAVMDIYEKISVSLREQEVNYFKSWLYTVAKNHCLMSLRKKEREIHSEFLMEKAIELHQYESEGKELKLDVMEKCIEELKNGQKECIKLFYLEEKSYKEIESMSDYSMKEVKSNIQNGKRNLKICMEQNEQVQ